MSFIILALFVLVFSIHSLYLNDEADQPQEQEEEQQPPQELW